jgi:hypothetical protein
MQILIPIFFVLFIVAFVAYILKRDSEIDEGKSPWVVKVPNTTFTLTPSRGQHKARWGVRLNRQIHSTSF